jgi:non-canonical purine NTP pyrophosphatase (RdgB/HAM1 family)
VLYFITGNAGKFAEVKAIIPEIEQLKLPLDEIQSLDPQAVIEHKLNQAAAQHDGDFIVEDTSVELPCLNGLPGTFIKFFEDTLGPQGLADLVARYDDRRAMVKTIIGYRPASGEIQFFTGTYQGEIVAPRGTNGFGFDPVMLAEGQSQTNAELTREQKNQFNGRGKAARQLAEFLATT